MNLGALEKNYKRTNEDMKYVKTTHIVEVGGKAW